MIGCDKEDITEKELIKGIKMKEKLDNIICKIAKIIKIVSFSVVGIIIIMTFIFNIIAK